MKKTVATGICVLLTLLMLIPVPLAAWDGRSASYAAFLYPVEDVPRINDTGSAQEVPAGIIIRILGIEVFNHVA